MSPRFVEDAPRAVLATAKELLRTDRGSPTAGPSSAEGVRDAQVALLGKWVTE
jgi:hypothetical protein